MLRRYLIVNGLSTAVMYGAVWTFAPSVSSAIDALVEGVKLYAMDNMWLGPLLHGVVSITSGL